MSQSTQSFYENATAPISDLEDLVEEMEDCLRAWPRARQSLRDEAEEATDHLRKALEILSNMSVHR